MKSIIVLFAFALFTSLTIANPIPGEPIPGCDVKVGRRPPPPGQIIATGVTNKDGVFLFKDLTPGNYTYYVEFGIREKGIKGDEKKYVIDGIVLPKATPTSKAKSKIITKTIVSQEHGLVDLTITYDGNSIRGSINISRSNIK